METAQQYERWTVWWRCRSGRVRALRAFNSVLTGIGYVVYPLLLVLLFVFARDLLLRCIAVPVVGFIICTVVRRFADLPRPYERLQISPLIPKDTKGRSFPSRHAFCMFTIACSWFLWQPVAGAVLFVLACLLAVIRVLGGVHFPRDVVAGAILAIVICVLGYCCVPW